MDKCLRYRNVKNYNQLGLLKASLQQLSRTHLSPTDLEEHEIQLTQLSLYPEDTIDYEPRFCIPFSANKIDSLLQNFMNDRESEDYKPHWPLPVPHIDSYFYEGLCIVSWFKKVLGCGYWPDSMLSSTEWMQQYGATRQHRLRGEISQGHYWRTEAVLHALPQAGRWRSPRPNASEGEYRDTAKPKKPHIASILIEDSIGDYRIFRSEMIVALASMREQMRIKENQDHCIFPVFVYTFSGRRARVVQVHFDGTNITVRPTEWMDFEEENTDNITLMLRWMMNTPIGDTSFHSLKMYRELESSTEELQ